MSARALTFARLRPRLALAIFVLIPLFAFWLVVFFQLRAEENHVRVREEARSQAVATRVANHVAHVLRQAQHATQLFKVAHEASGGGITIARHANENRMVDSVAMARLELPIARVDRSGRVVDSAHDFPLLRLPPATMLALQQGGRNRALISTARVGDGTGNGWRIEVAGRLNDSDGGFDGAIVLMVDPAYFAADFDRHDLAPSDLLAIGSREQRIATGRIGARMFSARTPAISGRGSSAAPGPGVESDPVPRIHGSQDVDNAPVVVTAGIDERGAMAEFRRHRVIYLVMTGVASFLIGAAFIALMRQRQRLSAAMRQAHRAQGRLRAAIDGSSDSFFILQVLRDAQGTIRDFEIVDLNERAAAMAGKPRAELVGKPGFATLPQFRRTGLFERYCEIYAGGKVVSEEIELHPEGELPRWIYHQVVPIEGGIAISARDISARKRAELEILDHRTFLMSLVDHAPLLVAVRTAGAGEAPRMVVWNKAAAEMTGYATQDVIGKRVDEVFPPGFSLSAHGAGSDGDVSIRRKGGEARLLHSITVPLNDENGMPEYVLTIAEDITLRRQQELQLRQNAISLRESEARLRTVADTIPAMVAYVDAAQVYRFHNRAFVPEFATAGDVIGMSMRDALDPQRYARVEPYVRRVLAGERLAFEDTDMHDGVERTMQVAYIPQLSEDGAVLGFHIMRQDVTHQKREKKQLLKLAQHDPLTGLANWAGFDVKLKEAMEQCEAEGTSMALMFVDIDRFKPVNDTYGHTVGDELLKAIAARMTHALRSSDTLARLGGDEFTVIIEHVQKPDDAAQAAAKLVVALHAPFELAGATVSISGSIGVALYSGDGASAGDLLARADDMLYEAKEAGRDTFRMAV